MVRTLKDLRDVDTGVLIAEHDEIAEHTQVGVNYYLAELARRDLDGHTKTMLAYTRSVKRMTIVIMFCTIVSMVAVIASVCRGP